jgi:hypothetical protein
MENGELIEYLSNGCFIVLMQQPGVGFELNRPLIHQFVDFLIIKKTSTFAFVSFVAISHIVPITNPDEDRAYLEASFNDGLTLMEAMSNTDWTYSHAIFSPYSNMAPMGGMFILNVDLETIKIWLGRFQVNWVVFGETDAMAQYIEFK